MALKRAALLEKRLRREKEAQLRKQQLEADKGPGLEGVVDCRESRGNLRR